MADPKKIIAAAQDSLDIVKLYPATCKLQIAKVKQYFIDRNILFSQINAELKTCEKDADGCDKRLTDAQKALKDLVSARLEPKLQDDLEKAIQTGKATMKVFRTDIEQLARYASAAETGDTKIAKAIGMLEKPGKDILQALDSAIMTTSGKVEVVEAMFERSLPKAKIRAILAEVTKQVKDAGTDLLSGRAFVASVQSVSKNKADAFLVSTRAALTALEAVSDDVEQSARKFTPLHLTAVNLLAGYAERLSALPD